MDQRRSELNVPVPAKNGLKPGSGKDKRKGASSPAFSLESLDEILASRPNSRKSKQSSKTPRDKGKRNEAASLGSLASILGSEDGGDGRRSSVLPKIPGYVSDEEDWEAESTFSDSGFGLPAVDVSEKRGKSKNGKGQNNGNLVVDLLLL